MSQYINNESDSEDELPPGWEERSTLEGDVFYANHLTKSTQWDHPRTGKKKKVSGSLPFGWERKVEDGKVIYVDHMRGRTTFTDPRLAFAVEENKTFVRQRFDASSAADQILHGRDLSDTVTVITGANSGIGFEMARVVVRHGGKVALVCRTMEKAENAREKIGRAGLERAIPFEADLTSFTSVKRFSDDFHRQFDKLDVLILNAGVFGNPFRLTEENECEEMMQVNYLSQVYLAYLLRDLMTKVIAPRLVFLTSESHRFATFAVDTLSMASFFPNATNFTSISAYNNSKLLALIFSLDVNYRWRSYGLRGYPVHPGNMVSTNLSRNWWVYRLLFTLVRPFTKSVQQAASSPIFSAFAPEMEDAGGTYINNCFPCDPSPVAMDTEMRASCWQLTRQILGKKLSEVGIEFDPEDF